MFGIWNLEFGILRRTALLCLALLTTPLFAASYTPKRIPGADIFDNKTVLPLRIEISSNELARLRRNDREDVRATVWEDTKAWRDVGLGAQILRDLNVSSIRLLSSSNRHYVGLSGFGIEISGTVKLEG